MCPLIGFTSSMGKTTNRATSVRLVEEFDMASFPASSSQRLGEQTGVHYWPPGAAPPQPGLINALQEQSISAAAPVSMEKCMSSMQMGNQMVKLRGGSKGLVRFFYLDEHKSCIRWRPSRKNEKAKISVDSVREVCEGKQSEIFQRYSEGSFDPNCCFSLYYGEHMESLDLVSGTGEEARTWITGLKYLMAGISDEDSLAKRQRTRDQYPSAIQKGRGGGGQTFTEADKNGDSSLSIGEVMQLLHKLNVNLPRQKVKQMFKMLADSQLRLSACAPQQRISMLPSEAFSSAPPPQPGSEPFKSSGLMTLTHMVLLGHRWSLV
ncbi:hypothetical protein NQZ68_029307 [Dissostichus eleginoides]|nr:hypothetical protein NQZ68_029307 [Dissostichus eleginoides]